MKLLNVLFLFELLAGGLFAELLYPEVSPLMAALRTNASVSAIKEIIEQEPGIIKKDEREYSVFDTGPLTIATFLKNEELIGLLIQCGADVNLSLEQLKKYPEESVLGSADMILRVSNRYKGGRLSEVEARTAEQFKPERLNTPEKFSKYFVDALSRRDLAQLERIVYPKILENLNSDQHRCFRSIFLASRFRHNIKNSYKVYFSSIDTNKLAEIIGTYEGNWVINPSHEIIIEYTSSDGLLIEFPINVSKKAAAWYLTAPIPSDSMVKNYLKYEKNLANSSNK